MKVKPKAIPESFLPAVTGGEKTQIPRDPAVPKQRAKGTNLRGQVMELINDVLTDPAPDGEWARSQLRKHLASHPDAPEQALLEHLVETRKLASPKPSLPVPRISAVAERSADPNDSEVAEPGRYEETTIR